MKKIPFILFLLSTLWNAVPAESPVRRLFDLVESEVETQQDPNPDPPTLEPPAK